MFVAGFLYFISEKKMAIDIDNYGTGDLYYQISFDGTNYGSAIYLPTTDTDSLRGLSIAKLKITHVADTKYRVRIV